VLWIKRIIWGSFLLCSIPLLITLYYSRNPAIALVLVSIWVALFGALSWWALRKPKPAKPRPERYQIKDRDKILESVDPAEEDPEVFEHFLERMWPYIGKRLDSQEPHNYNKLIVQNTAHGAWTLQNFTDHDFDMMGRAQALEEIQFDLDNLADNALLRIARAPRLRSITARIEPATDQGVLTFATKKMEHFGFSHGQNISESAWRKLLSSPQLKSLYFAACPMSGDCFEAIRGSDQLRTVQLFDLEGLTDRVFEHLATLPNLEHLHLLTRYYPHRVTSAGVARFLRQRMPEYFNIDKSLIDDRVWQLMIKHGWLYGARGETIEGDDLPKARTPAEVRSIHLYDTLITDAGFAAVEDCVNITCLSLEKTKVTDLTLKKIANFRRLTFLGLSQTNFTPRGLMELVKLPIKRLNLDDMPLTEDHFKVLGRISALEELHLSRSTFRVGWVHHLRALPQLNELYMQGIQIVPSDVKYLAALTNVKSINVAESNLIDDSFRQLAQMPQLESLNAYASRVSAACCAQMQQIRPEVHLSSGTD